MYIFTATRARRVNLLVCHSPVHRVYRASFLPSRPNRVPPPPHTQAIFAPAPFGSWGETHSLAGEGMGRGGGGLWGRFFTVVRLKEDKEYQKLAYCFERFNHKNMQCHVLLSEGVECVIVQLLVPSAKKKHFSRKEWMNEWTNLLFDFLTLGPTVSARKECAVRSFSRQTAYPGLARTSALNTSHIKKHVLVAHAFN